MKNKKVEYKYDKNDRLIVTINLKDKLFKMIINFMYVIVMVPLTVIVILGVLKVLLTEAVLDNASINNILVLLALVSITGPIGGIQLYKCLKYNFGQDILILDNKEKVLKHQLLICGVGKVKRYNYSDIYKIENTFMSGRIQRHYCYFIYKGKKYEFGDFEDSVSGKLVVKRINDFIKL